MIPAGGSPVKQITSAGAHNPFGGLQKRHSARFGPSGRDLHTGFLPSILTRPGLRVYYWFYPTTGPGERQFGPKRHKDGGIS